MSDIGTGRGMRCDEAPILKVRMSAEYIYHTIIGIDEMKRNEINEMNVEK